MRVEREKGRRVSDITCDAFDLVVAALPKAFSGKRHGYEERRFRNVRCGPLRKQCAEQLGAFLVVVELDLVYARPNEWIAEEGERDRAAKVERLVAQLHGCGCHVANPRRVRTFGKDECKDVVQEGHLPCIVPC